MLKGRGNIEFISLVALALQNAICTVLVRHSRTRKADLFISSTAVILCEVVKLHASLFLVYLIEARNPAKFFHLLNTTIVKQPADMLKMSVPSVLYVFQNNLFFVASTYLDATSLQVTYQLRILTTALFAVLILQKSLDRNQWLSLIILSVGIAQIQIAGLNAEAGATRPNQSRLIGTLAALSACGLSSFAGVYFEKNLKNSEVSLWMRNVQLSAIAIPAGVGTTLVSDWNELNERGFFYGYDCFVILVILMQALSGLLVAVVINYADNILRGFATSFAIIISCILSMYFFDFHLSWEFSLGTVSVMIAVFLYQIPLPKKRYTVLSDSCDELTRTTEGPLEP